MMQIAGKAARLVVGFVPGLVQGCQMMRSPINPTHVVLVPGIDWGVTRLLLQPRIARRASANVVQIFVPVAAGIDLNQYCGQ